MKKEVMKHVPNALTILRLIMVPIFVMLFFSPMKNNHIYALAVFLAASITDILDGYIARKYDLVSIVGIVLDPLADKLMLLTALICLTISGLMPLWVLVIMLLNESILIITAVFMYFRKEKSAVPANIFGKIATVLFSIAVFMLIVLPGYPSTKMILIIALLSKIASFTSYGIGYLQAKKNQ
jgi:cardiolipin synthase